MKCILGFHTAAQQWRAAIDPSTVTLNEEEQAIFLDLCIAEGKSPNKNDASSILSRQDSCFAKPIVFCVFGSMSNKRTSSAEYRRCLETLPTNSLVLLDQNCAVCSPELTFIQYAAECCDLIQAIQFGYELCGSYRFNISTRNFSLEPRAAVTTPSKIRAFCKKADGIRGIKRARVASEYILANSASPMETILALLISLPVHMGGFAIPKPKLNHPITRDDGSKDSTGRTRYYADLCWPEQKVCLEYDSDSFHLDSDSLSADSEKRTALQTMGWTTFSITRQEIMDPAALEKTIGALAKALGFRQRRKNDAAEQKQKELQERLLHNFSLYE